MTQGPEPLSTDLAYGKWLKATATDMLSPGKIVNQIFPVLFQHMPPENPNRGYLAPNAVEGSAHMPLLFTFIDSSRADCVDGLLNHLIINPNYRLRLPPDAVFEKFGVQHVTPLEFAILKAIEHGGETRYGIVDLLLTRGAEIDPRQCTWLCGWFSNRGETLRVLDRLIRHPATPFEQKMDIALTYNVWKKHAEPEGTPMYDRNDVLTMRRLCGQWAKTGDQAAIPAPVKKHRSIGFRHIP